MKKLFVGLIPVFPMLFYSCASFNIENHNFIKVTNSKFTLNNQPYYFLGTNLWYGAYLGSSGKTGNRKRLIKELDLLHELGVDNLRILAASEKTEFRNSLSPAIQIQPNVYDDDILIGLDFLLNEMGKRNMKAVLYLNNYWEWSGGMNQYNFWTNGETVLPPKEDFDWGEFMRTSATFYSNDSANVLYQNYIKKIITRKNSFNDHYYFEDPTIMSWQLANEPRSWGNENQIAYYYKWIDSTAKFIHHLDPNHLISTGSEGIVGSLMSEKIYKNAHSSKYIDYLTFHLWIKNWNWYDAKNPEKTYDSAKTKALNYVHAHLRLAIELQKPVVLEEFGIARDYENFSPDSSVSYRNDFYELIFKDIYDSASAGYPISGSNFWGWGGLGKAANSDFIWKEGDDYTGDPPQEPQGLNSVFAVDDSTINLIRLYSEKMKNIQNENMIKNETSAN